MIYLAANYTNRFTYQQVILSPILTKLVPVAERSKAKTGSQSFGAIAVSNPAWCTGVSRERCVIYKVRQELFKT